MLAEITQAAWIEKFRQVMEHYVPPLESSPAVNVGGLVAIIIGVALVFRGGKFEKIVVTAFTLLVGCWLGYKLAVWLNLPAPFTIAIVGLGSAGVGFKFYKAWLAAGSVFVLFAVAVTFQLGQGDLQRYLPSPQQFNGRVVLPSPDQQIRNSRNDWRDQLKFIGERIQTELKDFGLTGWVLPVFAALVGGALAYWALRAFAVVWLGFIGSHMAVLGGATILCANWHEVRDSLFASPQFPAVAAIGLWMLGLIFQAKEARFPKKPVKEADKEPAKS